MLSNHDFEQVLENIAIVDKAFKTLKEPHTRRIYDANLRLGKIEELDDNNAYDDLRSEKSLNDFLKTLEEKKKKKQASKESATEFKHPELKNPESLPADNSMNWNINPEYKKYISYLWGLMGATGLLFFAMKKL